MMATETKGAIDTAPVTGIVGYRLRRAQLHIFQQFIERFADHEIRPAEYSVLSLIAANPGRKQTEIAAVLGIKRANFVALVAGLDGRGLVDRRAKHGDRRSHALYLTEAGRALLEEIDRRQAEFEAECISRLGGEAERDQLVRLLDRLMTVGR
jgi:DNA-binding MarR family transcriptional regulator